MTTTTRDRPVASEGRGATEATTPTRRGQTPNASSPAIELCGLSKDYGGGHGIIGLDLRVERGEVFGFLGPNGSGKSTTIRTLLGFLRATAGTASVMGIDALRDSLSVRRHVGYLPSGPTFDEVLKGRAVLDDLAALQGSPSPRRGELCDRLGLSDHDLDRHVRDWSRGMRQKLGLVQALQHDPEVAILDEPSESLDPLVQRALHGVLEDCKERGRTVFFSSHVLSEVQAVCDRVAVIRAGRLLLVDTVPALLARSSRRVTVVGARSLDVRRLSGATDVQVSGDVTTFRLAGPIDPFLQAVAAVHVRDLTIEPATLDDVFVEMIGSAEDPR